MAIDLAALGFASGDNATSASSIEEALNADDNVNDNTADENKESSEDDIIIPDRDLKLNEENEEESDEDEESDEEASSEEDEDEEEKELDLDNEDELELAKIPKRQELKKAYPDIFKKFPALDHIIQREHAFAEVFPTVGDAKAAKEAVGAFNTFQSNLLDGDIESVLSAVKKTDPKAFDKISRNFLDSLIKIDSNAHLPVTQRVTKSIFSYIHNSALSKLKRDPSNEDAGQLKLAVEILHNALYDTPDVTPYDAKAESGNESKANPEEEKFRKERDEFEKTRYQTAFSSVSSRINTALTNAVNGGIDPKNILPPYVKSKLVTDVMGELDRQLSQDTRFRGVIDKLWIKAKDSNYSDASLANIRKALSEKAKVILPGIMKAKKGEAMKGLSTKKETTSLKPKKEKEEERAPRRESKELTSSRRDNPKLPRPDESNLEFLMRD